MFILIDQLLGVCKVLCGPSGVFFFFFWALINCCVLLTVTPIILHKIQGLPGGNFIDLGRINAIPPVLNGINLLLGIYNFLYSP